MEALGRQSVEWSDCRVSRACAILMSSTKAGEGQRGEGLGERVPKKRAEMIECQGRRGSEQVGAKGDGSVSSIQASAKVLRCAQSP